MSKKAPSGNALRVLCLGGNRANGEITKMQVRRLGLYDLDLQLFFLHGPYKVGGADDFDKALGVGGPFYSWVEPGVDRFDEESMKPAMDHVTKHLKSAPTYHALFGFCMGGLVASLVAGKERSASKSSTSNSAAPPGGCGGFLAMVMNIVKPPAPPEDDGEEVEASWCFVIAACSLAMSPEVVQVKEESGFRRGFDDPSKKSTKVSEFSKVRLPPSLHLIGMKDQLKNKSMELASKFPDSRTYRMNYAGHNIPNNCAQDNDLQGEITSFIQEARDKWKRAKAEAIQAKKQEVEALKKAATATPAVMPKSALRKPSAKAGPKKSVRSAGSENERPDTGSTSLPLSPRSPRTTRERGQADDDHSVQRKSSPAPRRGSAGEDDHAPPPPRKSSPSPRRGSA